MTVRDSGPDPSSPARSAPSPISGVTTVCDYNGAIKAAFFKPVHCRHCGDPVEQTNFQAVLYNGGIMDLETDGAAFPPRPYIFCGCYKPCLMQFMVARHKERQRAGVS